MKIYRHGDVNLHEAMEVKGVLKAEGKYILARGEATGSVHEISTANPNDLEIYEYEGTILLKLSAPAELTHTSDHETLTIEPGIYKQVPERELDHFADSIARNVTD